MFQPGDELQAGLEPADERGIVGPLWPAHDHRHLTPDCRLVGPVHTAEWTLAERLTQLVAAHGEGFGEPVAEPGWSSGGIAHDQLSSSARSDADGSTPISSLRWASSCW